MANADSHDEHDFDVAVSFAGEDRELVEVIVRQVQAAGHRVFYDEDAVVETWGADLVEYFDAVYRIRSRYVVIFVSQAYASKVWTRHERRSALSRAIRENGEYVLPVRLDDTELAGIRDTIGYLDARIYGTTQIAEFLSAKLSGSKPSNARPIERVPRTEFELQRVLLDRPPGWEYLYFAGMLKAFLDQSEDLYRDYSMGFAPLDKSHVVNSDVIEFIQRRLDAAQSTIASFNRVMSFNSQARVFDVEKPDPESVARLAKRWNDSYVGLISWSSKVLGTTKESELDNLFERLSRLVNEPIEGYRKFVGELVRMLDALPGRISSSEPMELNIEYTMTIDDADMAACTAELDRLRTVGAI